MAGGMAAAAPVSQTPEEARAQRLMNLLTTTVQPETWTEAGGTGSIAEFEGLIVVRQSAKIHKEVEKVLTMLREAAGKPTPASDKEAKKEAGGQPLAPPLSPPPVAR